MNTKEYWDGVYEREITHKYQWRTYPVIFYKISSLLNSKDVVDEYGCGTGILGDILFSRGCDYTGYDISEEAINECNSKGLNAFTFDILNDKININKKTNVIIASEFLEHFTDEELNTVMEKLSYANEAFFVVPDNVLGPEDCDEHYQKWNKSSFEKFLKKYYKDVQIDNGLDTIKTRLETISMPYLLAYCNK